MSFFDCVCVRTKILIAIQHYSFVPFTDPYAVCVRQIEVAAVVEFHQWKRIVHDGGTALRTRGKIMLDPERMADFVCR